MDQRQPPRPRGHGFTPRPSCYTVRVHSQAAQSINLGRVQRYARMSAAERVAVALRLAEDGLASFMLTQGLDRDAAIRRIKALHRLGRRPSACAVADAD